MSEENQNNATKPRSVDQQQACSAVWEYLNHVGGTLIYARIAASESRWGDLEPLITTMEQALKNARESTPNDQGEAQPPAKKL